MGYLNLFKFFLLIYEYTLNLYQISAMHNDSITPLTKEVLETSFVRGCLLKSNQRFLLFNENIIRNGIYLNYMFLHLLNANDISLKVDMIYTTLNF